MKMNEVRFPLKLMGKHKVNGSEVVVISTNVIDENHNVCYLFTDGHTCFTSKADTFIMNYDLKPVEKVEER